MILADENIDQQLIDGLRAQGVDVYSIAESHAGEKSGIRDKRSRDGRSGNGGAKG